MNRLSFFLLFAAGCISFLFSQAKTKDTDPVRIILSSPGSDSAKAGALIRIISGEINAKNYELAKAQSIKSLDYFKGKNNMVCFIQVSEPYGDAYLKQKNYDSAIYVYKNSVELAELLADTGRKKQLKAKMYGRIAKAFERISYDSSLTYYALSHESYSTFTNNHADSLDHVNGIAMLAYCYLMTGNAKQGYETGEQAAKMADELKDNQMKSQTYSVLGTILNELNLTDKAISTLQIAAEAGLAANDSVKTGQSYNSIALVYLKLEKYPDALKYYYKALEYINKTTSSFRYATICYNVIYVLCDLDSVKRAEYYLKELTDNVTTIKTDKTYLGALLVICNYYSKKGDLLKADNYMKQAAEVIPLFRAHHQLMDFYLTKANLSAAKGNYRESFEAIQMHHTYKDSISTTETEEMVAEKNTIYETEKKEQQILLLQKDNEIKTVNEVYSKRVRNLSFAGIAVLIVFGALTFYRFKQRKQLSEKLSVSLTELTETQQQLIETERQREQENVRLRISRDLHDDIGSTLSSINLLSHSAKKRMEEKNDVKLNESLVKIGERTQNMLDNMNDIIWSIKPENDLLASMLSRMCEYAGTVLEAKGINYTIDFPPDNADIHLTPDLKNNMYLIFKEAVNNLAKYSECSKAHIGLKIQDHTIRLAVEDNGKGFDTSQADGAGGNGLSNMKRRAEESGAELSITSESGRGSRVEFIVSI